MNIQRNRATLCCCLLCIAVTIGVLAGSSANSQLYPTEPQTIRDLLWVWGIPQVPDNDEPSLSNFARCSSMQRAELLGVPNVFMAGAGLPLDETLARQIHETVAKARALVWELSPDHGPHSAPFVYDQRLTVLRKLIADYPQPPVVGVLLDDMSSLSVTGGLKPDDLGRLRRSLPTGCKLLGVIYTMNMRQPGMDAIIKELEVINLWTWHAKDVVNLEKNVAYCEQIAPGKPIVLGLYMHDYGGGRAIPHDLYYQQVKTALELAHARRIEGIVFLTVSDDPPVLKWTADWIKRVGDQKIGQPRPWKSAADDDFLLGYRPLELRGRSVHILVNEDWSLDIQDNEGKSLWNGRDTYAPRVQISTGGAKPRSVALASAGQRSVEPFSDGRHKGYLITLRDFPKSDVEMALTVAINPQTDELLVQIAQTGGQDVATQVDHLYRFEQPIVTGDYLVIPHGVGYLFTADISQKLAGEGLVGNRYSLPLFGLKQGNYGMYAITETWQDCLVQFAHYPGKKWELDFHWVPAQGGLTYPRRLLLRFGRDLDYVKMAKGYRRYARDQGLLRTLEEKSEALPLLRRFLDGIEFRWAQWSEGESSALQSDYTRGFMGRGGGVEAIKEDLQRLHDMGFKLNFFFPKVPSGGYAPGRPADANWASWMLENPVPGGWPALVDLAEYARSLGFPIKRMLVGRSLPWGRAPEALGQALDHSASHGLTQDALYLDSYTAHNGLPADRRARAAEELACFQEVARRGIIPGGELPRFWAMGDACFYFYDGVWSSDKLPVGEPIPWLQLVFGDCYFAHFAGGGYEQYLPGGGVDWWPDRNPRLYELLFATAPSYNWLPNGQVPVQWDDPGTMKRWRWLRIWSAYFRAVATSEMVSHEFISPDRKQQRVTFANGTVAEFDMEANRFRVWGVPGFQGRWIVAPQL